MRFFGLFAVSVGLGLSTLATAAEFKPIPGKEFREVLNARMAVNGESVVGVTLATGGDNRSWQGLWLWVPAGMTGRQLRLSVEIASIDAVYRGSVELEGSSDQAGWIRLPVSPTLRNLTPFLHGDALAVSVRDLKSGSFLVATWAPPAKQSNPAGERIRLHVNSQRGDIYLQGERCVRIRWDRLTRFDSTCDLPVSMIPDGGVLTLLRRDGFARSTQEVSLLY